MFPRHDQVRERELGEVNAKQIFIDPLKVFGCQPTMVFFIILIIMPTFVTSPAQWPLMCNNTSSAYIFLLSLPPNT